MDEVDRTIITQLKDIDCPIDDETTSLRDLDVKQIISCVLHCLRIICPKDDSIPIDTGSNTNMATKYNITTFMANKCVELGFRGDLGYQSFLYGSESDIRRVFLFLIEKLPRESSIVSTLQDKELTVADIVRKSGQLDRIWMPPFSEEQDTHEEIETFPLTKILIAKSFGSKQEYYESLKDIPIHDIATVMKWNRIMLNPPNLSSKFKASTSSDAKEKPIPKPKPRKFVTTELTEPYEVKIDPLHEEAKLSPRSEEEETTAKSPLEILQEETAKKNELVIEVSKNIHSLEQKVSELESTLKEEHLKLLELKSRNLTIEELQQMEDDSKAELEHLKQAWNELKSSLTERLNSLKGRQIELENELSEVKQQISSKRLEIQTKGQLLTELTNSIPDPFPPTRSSYTKRIMEVIEKMKKLDDENSKVIRETRSLQKEITFLTGKVQRSFSIADETIFAVAKSNTPTAEFGKRVYKLLATMREESDKLSTSIESLGQVKRDILKLEESVSKQSTYDVDTKLKQIQSDYNEMKETNRSLIQQLEQKGVNIE